MSDEAKVKVPRARHKQLGFRLYPATVVLLKTMAELRGMTVTEYIEWLVDQDGKTDW